jgi:predicted nucleotidyltransferase
MTTLSFKREFYAQRLAQELDNLIRQLRQIPAVQQVILFGSYAHGQADLLTDLDLLVVMSSDLDFVSRCAHLAGQLHAGVALDLLVYTPKELERLRDRPFIDHILKTGKVVYEKKPAL